jgi:integrase
VGQVTTDFKHWADEWLAIGRPGLSATRLRADRSRVEKYVLPTFGRRSVARIREHDITEWLESMEAEGIGKSTQHASLICLRGTIQWAMDSGLDIKENPARGISVQGMQAVFSPTLKDVMSDSDLHKILKAVDPHYYSMVLLAARTGAKWEECVGLKVADLHLERGMVTVGRTRAVEREGGLEYEEGTGVEVRLVEIGDKVVEALKATVEELAPYRSKDWDWVVLTKRDHKHPLRPNFNTFTWRPALRHAGIDDRKYTFHDLRHYAAFDMIVNQGLSAEEVSRNLGHTLVRTTSRIYRNFFQERKDCESGAS